MKLNIEVLETRGVNTKAGLRYICKVLWRFEGMALVFDHWENQEIVPGQYTATGYFQSSNQGRDCQLRLKDLAVVQK